MKKGVIKTILAVVCSFVFVFGLAACDNGNGNDDNNNNGTTTAEHTLTEHKAKDATCIESGSLAYWECTDCGKLFSDKDGKTETTLAAVTVAATGHVLTKTDGKPATCKDEGITEYWTCTVCEKLFSDGEGKTEIAQADTVIPVTDNHTYGDIQSDNGGHWKECEVCGKAAEKADHDFGDGLTCAACSYEYDPAKDTAPATPDELFPDETTATAVELARAEYYQGVAVESLQPIRDFMENKVIDPAKYEVTNYSFDLGEFVNIVEKITISVDFIAISNQNIKYIRIYTLTFPKPLIIQDLFKEYDDDLTKWNFTSIYGYSYNNTTQGDKDEFIKAVAEKLAPDFDYTAPETRLIYTDRGSTLDDDYGTCRNFYFALISNKGVRSFSIITPNIADSELISYIQKDDFKLNSKTEIDFSKYQINVELTEPPAESAVR